MTTMWIATLLLLAPSDVLDVDELAGPYHDIQAAVDAAQNGDVVRVAPGDYASVSVIGKGLTLVAPGPLGTARIAGKVHIEDLPAGATVVVDGLRAAVGPVIHPAGLEVNHCDGAVRVQRCEFIGDHHGGAWVSHSRDVTLHDVEIRASPALSNPGGGAGLNCFHSTVVLWSTTARGNSSTLPGFAGGQGIFAYDSHLVAIDVEARGGVGGPDGWHMPTATCVPSGNGGPGVELWQSTLEFLDCRFVGGDRGPVVHCAALSSPGDPVSYTGPSSATRIPGGAPRFDAPALADESSVVTLTASGEPSDAIVLVVGPSAGHHVLPGVVGPLCVGGPLAAVRRAPLGVGSVTAPLQMPPLAPFAIEAFHLQTFHLRATGPVFGPPRVLTVLDSAW